MRGKLVVLEGIDCSGKTTTAKIVAKEKNWLYSKCMRGQTFIGRINKHFPTTIGLLIETVQITNQVIKPALSSGKTVLQDRYYMSLYSHPASRNPFNRLLLLLTRKAFLTPDVLVYFTIGRKEFLRRLANRLDDRQHRKLFYNSGLAEYVCISFEKQFATFAGEKIRIDTSKRNPRRVANEVLEKISRCNCINNR